LTESQTSRALYTYFNVKSSLKLFSLCLQLSCEKIPCQYKVAYFVIIKVKVSLYMPWRSMGGEEV
jgi:hypothetical protein